MCPPQQTVVQFGVNTVPIYSTSTDGSGSVQNVLYPDCQALHQRQTGSCSF